MAATVSNSYSFGSNTQVDDLFREAFERIGIVGNDLPNLYVPSAIMSANLELSSWPGKGLNLWLVQQQMFSLYPGQPIYVLPQNTVRLLEVVITNPTRLNTGGSAFSTLNEGVASNCFNPNQTGGCTLTSINGSIGYDYGAGNLISVMYVGITPLATSTYTLKVQYSFDTVNWTDVYIAPTQVYPGSQTQWFVINQSLNARAWRITETNGAVLAIQQIYFNQPSTSGIGDRMLGTYARNEWETIPNKLSQNSSISGYYFDQTMAAPSFAPVIKLWPVPDSSVALPQNQVNILYTSYIYPQDITQMFQRAQVPQRFYDALVAGLSSRLALKFATDKYPIMKAEAAEAYSIAAATDFENVILRFQPDFDSYGIN